MTEDDHTEDDHTEGVGSVGEEAAKLFGVLAGALRDVDQHVATGDGTCTYCPICRTVHLVRSTSPEVRAHLSSAAASLAQAAAGLLATAVPDEARARAGVERIDLDDVGPDAASATGTRQDDSEDHWAEDE